MNTREGKQKLRHGVRLPEGRGQGGGGKGSRGQIELVTEEEPTSVLKAVMCGGSWSLFG